MKKFMICAIALFLLLSTSVFGDTPPGNVQSTFKKMYPKANGVAWSQDDGYYCANFAMNGFTKNVWFNVRGQWVMTQTDLVSLRHFPLSLRIEPYIFGETVHYKIGTIVSVILRPGYIICFGIHFLEGSLHIIRRYNR